jgi:hypothetical protein
VHDDASGPLALSAADAVGMPAAPMTATTAMAMALTLRVRMARLGERDAAER